MNAPDNIDLRCTESYQRLKNLKLVANEVGIPWQSVYVRLRNAGVPVTGDKSRYGSDKDRLSAKAEQEFLRLIPFATCQNATKFQAPIDFRVGACGVDIKASTAHPGHKDGKYVRWSFSMKKQEMIADFVVCFGYHDDGRYELFLLPGELIRKYMTVSIPVTGKSKWRDYQLQPMDLRPFFDELNMGGI